MAISNYLVLYKALMWLMGNALNKGTKTKNFNNYFSYFKNTSLLQKV